MKKITNNQFTGEQRSLLLRKNIAASVIIKGWSVIVQLLLVPTTLSCLGIYENGVWLTISSVLLWIDNLDIGLGNGLRNKLAESIAKNDYNMAKQYISSTFVMLIVIIIPILTLLILTELLIDNYALFNVDKIIVNNLDATIIVATIMVCSTFVFKFIGNFFIGLQLPAINNLLVASGNTLALISTACISYSDYHSLLLVAFVNTASPLLAYIICYAITFYGKYSALRPSMSSVKMKSIKTLFSLGINFFVLQISGIILFFSANIIISQLFSPSFVTLYQIAHRYFMTATLFFSIIGVPYWNATTDAYIRKDYVWIKKSNKTLNILMLALAILILTMIISSNVIYRIWIGDKASIPFTMTCITGIYQFILIWSSRYSFVLNGLGLLRIQLIVTVIAAILFIPLAIFVGRITNNINCLLIVMCLINIPGLFFNKIQYKKFENGKLKGIWSK